MFSARLKELRKNENLTQIEFAKKLKYIKMKEIKGSKHEINLSNNIVLKDYLEEIFTFLED